MPDILFQTADYVFSYRVAGILIHGDRVLLQKTGDDDGYAFPGGHVAFGETNEETLAREFRAETGAEILVKSLAWVAEIFFPWDGKSCHQICLYYTVALSGAGGIPLEGTFTGTESMEHRVIGLEFHWIPLDHVIHLEIYPENAKELLLSAEPGVKHFVCREK